MFRGQCKEEFRRFHKLFIKVYILLKKRKNSNRKFSENVVFKKSENAMRAKKTRIKDEAAAKTVANQQNM